MSEEKSNVVPFPGAGPWAALGLEWRDVQPSAPVIISLDDVETARLLDVAGRAGKHLFQYAILQKLDQQRSGEASDNDAATHADPQRERRVGTDIVDLRDVVLAEFLRICREEWSEAECDRCLTDVWHAAHDFAEANSRFFGAEGEPIAVVSE